MAGSNPPNGNRQRNFSVASNTSTSSFKDNTPGNQRVTESSTLDSRRSRGQTRSHVSVTNESRDSYRPPNVGSFFPRDLNRPAFGFETFNSTQQLVDSHPESQDHFKKWFEHGHICSNQAQTNFGEPTPNVIRAELANSDSHHVSESRVRKHHEAQQRLLQLQELIQNVSLDLELNPFQHHHDDKIKLKDASLDFLRNVPSNQFQRHRTTSVSRSNMPRQSYRSPQQHYLSVTANGASALPQYSPQNNLSHDSIMSPKRYSTSSQINGSLVDVFGRSDPSFDSSNDEVDDNHVDREENDNISHAPAPQVLHGETNQTRNGTRVSSNFLERIEQQLERNNSMCEQIVAEQRRLALVTESLLSAISNMQTNNNRQNRFGNPSGFSVSGLPVNSSWNESNADYQVLAHAVNQCCILIAQLQRDIAAIQLGFEPVTVPAEASRSVESHPNVFREPKQRTSVPTFECSNIDRFDPEVTLNNRVPPGTRTNNYWDNFRSYSRQNLLSSSAQAPSNVNTSGEHQQTLPVADIPSQLQRNNPLPNGVHEETSPRQSRGDVSQVQRRTKRKVNKGQRQVEIGVHCPPHADNRALAYGLMSVRGAANNAGPPMEPSVVGRNLNPQNISDPGSPGGPTAIQPSTELNPSNNTKAVKDSTLNYSGARPKENRRTHETNLTAPNVNLLTEQETLEKAQGLETAIRNALADQVASPQFISQLLQLLQKLNSDPLRQRALNALEECLTESNRSVHHQSELLKAFNSVSAHHRDLTPSLLEAFLNAIQPADEVDQEEIEGAAAVAATAAQSLPDDNLIIIRETLSPYLYRRLSQVHDLIADALNKLDFDHQNREVVSSAQSGSEMPKAPSREDELAEADQSCDLSCDGAAARHDGSEPGVGLDEVPTRLMAVLAPPVWSNSRQSPAPNQLPHEEVSRTPGSSQNSARTAQRADADSATKIWFADDG